MFSKRSVPTLITLVVFWGCGGDGENPYEGFYKLVLHQEQEPCDGLWEDKEISAPFFYLKERNIFGKTVLGYHECLGSTVETCDLEGPINLFKMFGYKDGKWQIYITASSPLGNDCTLTVHTGELELTDGGIAWTRTMKVGKVTVDRESDCEPDLAWKKRDELDCELMERFEATLLEK